jgi:malic enzyme
VVGAGSAGMGVSNTILSYAMEVCGLTLGEARSLFWVTDNCGLLTVKRLIEDTPLLPHHETYLRKEAHLEGGSLLETVKAAKPTIILGLSGQGGVFTADVLAELGRLNQQPVIFAMSNPSDHAECTAEEAFEATEGRAIFASGSPFEDHQMDSGKLCKSNQGNNMYIFPGIGLGVTVGGCKLISQGMILCAAEALATSMKQQDLADGMVYPAIENIREVS